MLTGKWKLDPFVDSAEGWSGHGTPSVTGKLMGKCVDVKVNVYPLSLRGACGVFRLTFDRPVQL